MEGATNSSHDRDVAQIWPDPEITKAEMTSPINATTGPAERWSGHRALQKSALAHRCMAIQQEGVVKPS